MTGDDQRSTEQKPTLRERLRYRFDNLLARGTWATLVWLGIITFGVVALSGLLLAIFNVGLSGSVDSSYLEESWQSLLRVLDTGTMAGDVGWGRRVLALLVTLFGVLVAGTVIGVIAAGVEDRIERMRRGRSTVFESGHAVVLGSSDRLPTLIRQLFLARANRQGSAIVVMADRDPAEMQDTVRQMDDQLRRTRLVFRSGDPTNPSDLEIVGLDKADMVIVLTGDDGDAGAIRTVIGVEAKLRGREGLPVVVELSDPVSAARVSSVFPGRVHPLVPTQAVGRISALALREPGIGHVAIALLDDRRSDLHIVEATSLQGRQFAQIRDAYPNARPIGIVRADGSNEMNPSPTARLGPGDRLALISGSPDVSPGLDSEVESSSHVRKDVIQLDFDRPDQHIVVSGWSEIGSLMLADWLETATFGSTAHILLDPQIFTPDELVLPTGAGPKVDITMSGDVRDLAARLAERPVIDTILLLSPAAQLGKEQADSRTLLDLVGLRRLLAAVDSPTPRVIVELANADNVALADMPGVNDFVISDAIGSQLITQLAEQPVRRGVLLDLYEAGGPSLHMVPAESLGLSGTTRAAEIYGAAYRVGVLAIGYRRSGGELILNPGQSHEVDLDASDQIVIIG